MSTGQADLPIPPGVKAPQAARISGADGISSHGKWEPFLSPARWDRAATPFCRKGQHHDGGGAPNVCHLPL